MADAGRHRSRRSVLAGVGTAATAGVAGCLESFFSTSARNSPSPISLTVSTMPADDDAGAVRIARNLTENLSAAGIGARLQPEAESKLYRDVLVNREFDLVVIRHPVITDPDRLRTLLFSKYTEGTGWQNPFGYSDLDTDELLQRQCRRTGAPRERTVRELVRQVVRDQPFSVLAVPEYHSAASPSVAFDAGATTLQRPVDYLSVHPPDGTDGLDVIILDGRVTVNRNPLAVEYRERDALVDLLYDSLGWRVDGEIHPWLARDWEWTDGGNRRLRVTLRPDLTWHDGESLTATDAAFSYRFLSDTSLGEAEDPVPAPRFRGLVSMVNDATAVDRRTFEIELGECSRRVAIRALTVPVLPMHVWERKSTLRRRFVTQALVWDNLQPVGSGPLMFEGGQHGESLTLTRNPDHFLNREDLDGPLAPYRNRPAFEQVRFQLAPSTDAAIQLVEEGTADALGSPVEAAKGIPSDGSGVRISQDDTWSWYMLGFNARKAHLANPRFRRTISRLVDRTYVVESILNGAGRPSDVPPMPERFVPPDLRWNGESEVGSFPGTDGTVDPEAVRDLFRDLGYRYDDGTLYAD